VLIPTSTPYAAALSLGSERYTIGSSYIDELKAIKNDVEIQGFERAYLRDGAVLVQWTAWLEERFQQNDAPSEYEAAEQLAEQRKYLENFMGPAFEDISASGANAGMI
jgi:Xaa-Pro aminopeptidase